MVHGPVVGVWLGSFRDSSAKASASVANWPMSNCSALPCAWSFWIASLIQLTQFCSGTHSWPVAGLDQDAPVSLHRWSHLAPYQSSPFQEDDWVAACQRYIPPENPVSFRIAVFASHRVKVNGISNIVSVATVADRVFEEEFPVICCRAQSLSMLSEWELTAVV